MEAWRKELYHAELYHYGVKGMKWGKHLKAQLEDFYKKKISGESYLNNRTQITNSPGRPDGNNNFKYGKGNYTKNVSDHLSDSGSYLHNAKELRRYPQMYAGSRENGLRNARRMNKEGRRSENRAYQLRKQYYTKSLKGITESHIKKAKKFIATLKVKYGR